MDLKLLTGMDNRHLFEDKRQPSKRPLPRPRRATYDFLAKMPREFSEYDWIATNGGSITSVHKTIQSLEVLGYVRSVENANRMWRKTSLSEQ